MKGKILALGIISADDGNRYNFDVADIANLGNRNPENLSGCEVDFQVSENVAKSIYITKSTFNIHEISNKFMANDVQGIRFKFLLSVGLLICGTIITLIPFIGPFIGPIIDLIGFVCMILAVVGLNRVSASKTLLKNYIIALVIAFVTLVVAFAIGGTALIAATVHSFEMSGAGVIVAAIIAIVGFIATFVFQVFFARELAFITGQKFLLWAYYASIIGSLTAIIVIGYLFMLAACALWVIGLIKFEEIRKRTDSDTMPWF